MATKKLDDNTVEETNVHKMKWKKEQLEQMKEGIEKRLAKIQSMLDLLK